MTDKEHLQLLIDIFLENKKAFDEKMKDTQENTIWNKWIDEMQFANKINSTMAEANSILENLVKKRLLVAKRQINKRFYAVVTIPGYVQSKKDINCYCHE
jgi:chromosome condensin MukBEF complex kleisin-like MukF subunit